MDHRIDRGKVISYLIIPNINVNIDARSLKARSQV